MIGKMDFKITAQAGNARVNGYLTPSLQASLKSARESETFLGEFTGTATLLNVDGQAVNGLLHGHRTIDGKVDGSRTQVNFYWADLSILEAGEYKFEVVVFEKPAPPPANPKPIKFGEAISPSCMTIRPML